jgi:AAA domain
VSIYNNVTGAGQAGSSSANNDKFRDCLGDVARALLGPPNRKLCKMHELRWGERGSLSVDIRKGVWRDHETGQGGGTIKLVMRELKLATPAEAARWLEDHEYIQSSRRFTDDDDDRPKSNGKGDEPEERVHGDQHPKLGEPAVVYDYTDENGTLRHQNCRFKPKAFRPRQSDGNGSWYWDLDASTTPYKSEETIKTFLYRLPRIIEAVAAGRTTYICEGEKDALTAIEKLGLDATCNQGGCGGGWREQYNATFKDADVVIVPHHDVANPDPKKRDAGLRHANKIAASLSGVAARVRVLRLWESWPPCPKDGGDLSDWVEAGHTREDFDKLVEGLVDAEDANLPGQHWDGDAEEEDLNVAWLIHDLLPETGTGLLAGQWGLYKTFVAIDIALAIAHDAVFLGRGVRRPGGTVFFATEGAPGIKRRLRAVQSTKYKSVKRSPFTWFDGCPSLLKKEGIDELIFKIKHARAQLKRRHGLPLSLVVVDTVVNAAAYGKAGDENDAAINAALMANLAQVSRETGAFVLGVDHFGKAVETGTRGSSAKEGGADVVLAILGERTPGGKVSKTRMSLRKVRDGAPGDDYWFDVDKVTVGQDEVGEPITSLVIKWLERAPQQSAASSDDTKWGKPDSDLQMLRRIMMQVLGGPKAVQHKPHDASSPVQAVDRDVVCDKFHEAKMASTPRKKSRDTAFTRAMDLAQKRGMVESYVDPETGRTLVWLGVPVRGDAPSAAKDETQ